MKLTVFLCVLALLGYVQCHTVNKRRVKPRTNKAMDLKELTLQVGQ